MKRRTIKKRLGRMRREERKLFLRIPKRIREMEDFTTATQLTFDCEELFQAISHKIDRLVLEAFIEV